MARGKSRLSKLIFAQVPNFLVILLVTFCGFVEFELGH